jgi:hypothetical protein
MEDAVKYNIVMAKLFKAIKQLIIDPHICMILIIDKKVIDTKL